jgi:hypothetical protein
VSHPHGHRDRNECAGIQKQLRDQLPPRIALPREEINDSSSVNPAATANARDEQLGEDERSRVGMEWYDDQFYEPNGLRFTPWPGSAYRRMILSR